MLDVHLTHVVTLPRIETDEPYPNSGMQAIDQEFLSDLCKEDASLESRSTETRFWRRQFGNSASVQQKIFDWLCGVVLPVVCFYFDPVVFKSQYPQDALLERYWLPAYLLSYLAIMAVMACLMWSGKLGWVGAIVSGILAVSGVIAMVIGLYLFPFSLLGVIYLIGFLGFTPLFTSFVFLRNSVRAYRAAFQPNAST